MVEKEEKNTDKSEVTFEEGIMTHTKKVIKIVLMKMQWKHIG